MSNPYIHGRVRLFVIPAGTRITQEATGQNKKRPGTIIERIVQPNEGLSYAEDALIWQPNDAMYCFGCAGDIGTYGLGNDPMYLWVLKSDVIEKDKQVMRCRPPDYPKVVTSGNYFNQEWVDAYILS